jgi:hypothetical protein
VLEKLVSNRSSPLIIRDQIEVTITTSAVEEKAACTVPQSAYISADLRWLSAKRREASG